MNDAVGSPHVAGRVSATWSYLATRFPLPTQGIAIVLTFVSGQLLLGRAAGSVRLPWTVALGVLSFLLLFLQLRMVDDIDDLEQDAGTHRHTRAGLVSGLIIVWAVVAAVNLTRPAAFAGTLAAVTLTVLTPFWIKRRLTTGRVPLAVCYEATPLVIMAYPFLFWLSGGGGAPPPAPTVAVVVLFWSVYEFWKFSRKAPDLDYRPYQLGRTGVRVVLLALLCCTAACVATIAATVHVTPFFTGYQCVLIGLTGAWLVREWSMPPRRAAASRLARLLGLSGLLHAAFLQLGVVVEALLWTAD